VRDKYLVVRADAVRWRGTAIERDGKLYPQFAIITRDDVVDVDVLDVIESEGNSGT